MKAGTVEPSLDDGVFDVLEDNYTIDPALLESTLSDVIERCENSGVKFSEGFDADGDREFSFTFKAGRDERVVSFYDQHELLKLVQFPYEKYTFLKDWTAICSYDEGVIEAGIQSASLDPFTTQLARRIFSSKEGIKPFGSTVPLIVDKRDADDPEVEIGPRSELFNLLVGVGTNFMTIKFKGVNIKHHDATVEYLKKTAASILFQLDLIVGVPFVLRRTRKRSIGARRPYKGVAPNLQFPKNEFEHAPMSLYWYGRGATEMPLLQYLAFYQVIEFYFPIYSKSEALRKLKSVLRQPTFRADSDIDVSKLLGAVQVSRVGAFGDERSQLKATIDECVDQEDLRNFLLAEEERANFLSDSKSGYQKLSVRSKSSDLCADVATRIYEIRCKIVHTKTDSRDTQGELLLPFTKEADQLFYDIELVKYVAQQVLISSSKAYAN